jgi:DNA polymerase/3'-5' exonuclease PolX
MSLCGYTGVMKFKALQEKFDAHAETLEASEEANAKFRAKGYRKIARKIGRKADGDASVTKAGLLALGISDHMTAVGYEWATGKKLSAKKPAKKSTKKLSGKKSTKKLSGKKSTKKPTKKPSGDDEETKEETKQARTLTPAKTSELIAKLTGLMGIGKVKAQELLDAGLTTFNHIHRKAFKDLLPQETQAFLALKPLQKIPRAEIVQIDAKIQEVLKGKAKATIVGSYRRGLPFSKDIDVMLVTKDPGAIEEFLRLMTQKYPRQLHVYSLGRDKTSFIWKQAPDVAYKLDVFWVDPAESIPMLLYATGSKAHNIHMRATAKKQKMLLNQRGLYRKEPNGETKLVAGLTTEEAYFTALNLDYKDPPDRL